MLTISGLLRGTVVETSIKSFTGQILYSDYVNASDPFPNDNDYDKDSILNKIAKIPLLGIVAGITRIALGIIHTVGHLLAALFTQKKGHLYHAIKGTCEILRGVIEAIPVIGRLFANYYNASPLGCRCCSPKYSWWMIKMYNPQAPDALDNFSNNWNGFPQENYIKA